MSGAPRGRVPGIRLLAESRLCLVGSSLRAQVLSQHRKGPAEGWLPTTRACPGWNRHQVPVTSGKCDTLAGRSTVFRGSHSSGILDGSLFLVFCDSSP